MPRSAHPTSQGATLRGLGGNASSRALVMLDGVPLADPFGGWIKLFRARPGAAGPYSREPWRRQRRRRPRRAGGAPSSWKASDRPTAARSRGEALYGSRDSVDAGRHRRRQPRSGYAMISAHYQQGDGFTPIVADQRGPADKAAPYKQASVAGRAVFPVGDATELQANGMIFTDKRTRGTDFTNNHALGADASLRLVGHGAWAWEAAAWLQMRDFSSQFASVTPTRTSASLTLDQYGVPATGVGGRFEISPPLGADIDLHFGGDVRQTKGQTKEHYLFVAVRRQMAARPAGGHGRRERSPISASIQPMP